MTFLEAKKSLCRKLDINYDDIANNDLFTDEDLGEYINEASYRVWDFRSWDWAEHVRTATLLAGDITNGYVAYPTDIQPSSIFLLVIDGKEYEKKNFKSYKRYFENNSNANDKYWSEFKRMIFFNVNSASAGQVIDVYGKKNFVELSATTDLLPFSPDTDAQQYSGNVAVITLAYSMALSSDKKKNPQQGQIEEKRAFETLAVLAKQLEDGRASEHSKDSPMFDVPNFFGNRYGSTDRGRFSL
jgi:hypothetical protein